MPQARPLTVCLLVRSNSIGIDHVRMELTTNVRKRLRTYQALITKHDLMHLSVTGIPVTWIKDGEPVAEHANSASKIFSWLEILDGYLFIWGSFPHATQADGGLRKYTDVEASWSHGQTSWLINELPSHANAMREIWDSGLARTSAEEDENEALLSAVELRMQIKQHALSSRSAPIQQLGFPEPFCADPADTAEDTVGANEPTHNESPRDDSRALWEELTDYPGMNQVFAMLPQRNWGLWGREHLRARILVPKHKCLLLALQDAPSGSDRLIPFIQQWAQTHQISIVLTQNTEDVVRRMGLELLRLLEAEVVAGSTFVDFEDLRAILGAGKPNAIVHCGIAVVTVAQGAEKALSLALSQLGISDARPIETVFPHASGIVMACAVGRKGDERSKMLEQFSVVCKILKQVCARLPEIDALYVPIADDALSDEVRVTVWITTDS